MLGRRLGLRGLFVLVPLGVAVTLAAADWPEFRGPTGQGHSAESDLPLHWSESQNIAWKTPIPGRGWSSPAIEGSQIWMTSSLERGRSLRAIAADRETGRILHNVEVFRVSTPPGIHEKNTYASPTPILEKDRVYVHFGTLGTAALDRAGRILWTNQELRYQHGHGAGGSPVLAGDLLIISCDGIDQQYVVALDKNTGKIRWRTGRRDGAMAYSTPLVIDDAGKRQVVSPGANRTVSYDAETGEELWFVRYNGFSNVPRPVYGHGLVYITSGFYNPVLYAVEVDGRGDVTNSHVVWEYGKGIPLTSSPLLVGEEIYVVSDNGIATCLDALTGQEYWRQRLGGSFSASPVYADGRIYFLNESGETTVIEPGRKYVELARNRLDGRTLASIAVAGQAIFLRGDSHLYRIEKRD